MLTNLYLLIATLLYYDLIQYIYSKHIETVQVRLEPWLGTPVGIH